LALMANPAAIGEVVNIGSTEEVTIEALARRVKSLTGSSSRITHVPYSEAYEAGFEDMPRRLPDVTKIEQMIGFRPTRNLDHILGDVIAHERAAEHHRSPAAKDSRLTQTRLITAGA
jgi:UDP-glucose 4-epimerase